MSRQCLTVVFDTVAEAPAGVVIQTPSLGVAVRMFQDLANNPQSSISLHPKDYNLVHIGFLDGIELLPLASPVTLANASDLLHAGHQLDIEQEVSA